MALRLGERRLRRFCRIVTANAIYGVASLPLGATVELEIIFEVAG
jgi:hypothetical protein